MSHVISRCPGKSVMGNPVSRPGHFRMMRLVIPDRFHADALAVQNFIQFALSALLRLGQDHLTSRQRVDLGITLDFDWCVKKVGILSLIHI